MYSIKSEVQVSVTGSIKHDYVHDIASYPPLVRELQ